MHVPVPFFLVTLTFTVPLALAELLLSDSALQVQDAYRNTQLNKRQTKKIPELQ